MSGNDMAPSDSIEMPSKKPYSAPVLIEHGSVQELVQTGFRIGQDALMISDSLT